MFAKSHTMRQHPGQMAGIAGIGIGLGALTALLFTPRRGSEVRHGLKRRSLLVKDKAISMKQSKKDDVKEIAGDTKSTAKLADRKTKGMTSKVKQDAKDIAEEIRRNGEP